MPSQLVYDNVYAHSNTDHPVSKCELDLLRAIAMQAREKIRNAVVVISHAARTMEAQHGATHGLSEDVQGCLYEAFQLHFEKDPLRRLRLVQEIRQKFIRLEREMGGMLEIYDLPRTDWDHNLRLIERAVSQRPARSCTLTSTGKATSMQPAGRLGITHVFNVGEYRRRIYLCYPYLVHTSRMISALIHEASHLFLNTADHVYFDFPTNRWESPLNPQQAASNADSFATFANKLRAYPASS